MNSIDVFIYSYKNKRIKEIVDSILNNSNKNNKIKIWLIDQNPIDRKNIFKEYSSVNYTHIFWDWQISPCKYKYDAIKFSNSNYMMLVGDSVLFNKGWDDLFIDFVQKNDCVISGNKKINIKRKNLFFIEKQLENTDNFVLSNFINRDFIFSKKEIFKKINYPYYLKYNGEEELVSIDLYTNNIDTYAAPTDCCMNIDSIFENYYIPFSVNHNYNELINILHFNKNKYISFSNRLKSIKDFSTFHNFDFTSLKQLPFLTNDVDYNPEELNFNKVDARKFVARTKAIH